MRTRRQVFVPSLLAVLAGVVLPLAASGQAGAPAKPPAKRYSSKS